ncbi:CRAL-TRIO domain-containing protein [Paraphysoderma sedebokerense]|nr:CRAL-TRIO domain-containing protein [Paraphysoderma sedebokerense]
MSKVSPDMNKALRELRELLEDDIQKKNVTAAEYGEDILKITDDTLARFLIARENIVAKAYTQLLTSYRYRHAQNLDKIFSSFPQDSSHSRLSSDESKCIPYPIRRHPFIPDHNPPYKQLNDRILQVVKYLGGGSFHGFAKSGASVFIERVGLYDIKGLYKSCAKTDLEWTHCIVNECCFEVIMSRLLIGKSGGGTEESHKSNIKFNDKMFVIFDCSGMGWHQFHMPALPYLRAITQIDQDYYPERLEKVVLVNAPGMFSRIWSIIKGWIDKKVADKVMILGSNYQSTLLDLVDPTTLPKYLGGQCQH